MREARRGLGGVYQRGAVYWIRYSYRGRKVRESSHSTNEAAAVRLLKKRLGEMGLGKLPARDAERVTFEDLARIIVDDYTVNECTSVDRLQLSLKHLREHFGSETRAVDITPDALVAYVKVRRESGASASTVRNEMSALKRAFNLAVRHERLAVRPTFPVVAVNNARKGFFEEADFRAVLAHLDTDVRPLVEFLYWTGWRSGEAKALEWRNVDRGAGIIRIENSKNGEPRTLPFRVLPDLAALIARQRERTSAVEQATGQIIPWVFHRAGHQLQRFEKAWHKACAAAGLQRVPHDFRRTAARNLSRAGVPERTIMAICGWKTRSVFDRYRIVNEADLAEGLAKLATASASAPEPPKVVRLATGTVRAQSGDFRERAARLTH